MTQLPEAFLSHDGELLRPIRLTFRVLEVAVDGERLPHLSEPILVADVAGWPRSLAVHPRAGTQPGAGETWTCAVDQFEWIWPLERIAAAG